MFITKRIHGLPYSIMPVGSQLSILCQSYKRFLLPDCFIAFDIIHYFRFKYKEPTVHPRTVSFGFFSEPFDFCLIVVQGKCPESPGRLNGGYGCVHILFPVKFRQGFQINIAHPVTVSHIECFITDVLTNTLNSTACH